ncbi:MAG: redox-regulated ATPase YchF [Actinomycetota bacterium]|nr:redox-regulated ATPase YchF [Actinomycetota bacterium]MDD5665691.1 redox-regulated ATPase YchF [Actinomycetota bacterium]
MALQVGIIGLPNSGKSTIFNALTRAGAQVAGYPFSTVDPNVGVAPVPDERLQEVASAAGCSRIVPADLRVVDIAGLVEGAHHGEGLGNQFLAHIREVDALAHAVRLFSSPDVAHVRADIDPELDIAVVNTELILADLAAVERRRDRIAKAAKTGDRDKARELELLEKVAAELDREVPVRRMALSPHEEEIVSGLFLLTAKPVIYVANLGEEQLGEDGPMLRAVRDIAASEGAGMVAFSARLEAEIEDLEPDEVEEFLEAYGIESLGLEEFTSRCYSLLGLITFFTTESGECRAWPLPQGSTAVQAAGKIHTDMERGFIRAEVISWKEFLGHGSFHAARDKGAVRVEGRDYVVHDGDVILFRFS